MKIVQFNSFESANDKLNGYNILAIPEPRGDQSLATIHQHPTQSIWWFNATGAIENGGLAKEQIAADIETLDTFEVSGYPELVEIGYLPQPEDN